MPVSPATEARLRVAMDRLLSGQPEHTNGALTKENLAREAGVSHATVHRADTVLADWNTRVPCPVLRTPGEATRDTTISHLRAQLTQARHHATLLQEKFDALATVTATLYHQNRLLRGRQPPPTGPTRPS